MLLTFGVDERRTERSVEDPGDGKERVLLGGIVDAEPDVDVEGPAACSKFRPVGDLIDCCASRPGRPTLPLELVPSCSWYLLAQCGFGLLSLDDIARRLFYCLCTRWYRLDILCATQTIKMYFYYLLRLSDCRTSFFFFTLLRRDIISDPLTALL